MNKVFHKIKLNKTDYKLNNLYFTEHLYYWIYLQIYSKNNSIHNLPLSQSITTRQFNKMYNNTYNKQFIKYHIIYVMKHYDKSIDLYDNINKIDNTFFNEINNTLYLLKLFIKRVYFKVILKPLLDKLAFKISINKILRSKIYNYGLGLKLNMRNSGLELLSG